MTHITLDNKYSLVPMQDLYQLQQRITNTHHLLHQGTGPGNEFLGWLHLPDTYDKDEFYRIKQAAATIHKQSDILLVIGIGGSYLGARAAIEMLTHSFQNELPEAKRHAPRIIFAGHHISATYIKELFDVLKGKDISINVISKSGTTTEPAIAFRIFKKFMAAKYDQNEIKKRIFVTTDRQHGALKKIADMEGYETFTIPDNIGGRYSVLTSVGLLPMAAAGIEIDRLMAGARRALTELGAPAIADNPCYRYAAIRNILYGQDKKIELLISYEPKFHFLQEWWKQLFGESEGKDGKGIFPAAATFSTDLHSLGQYIQDGERHLFQTILHVKNPANDIAIEADQQNIDGLNYLVGKTMNDVNQKAFEGALHAHRDGGVPNLVLHLPQLDSFTFGYLVYFFEKACAISGYLLGVNPFDQPGVEGYKKNMFTLLGKPNK